MRFENTIIHPTDNEEAMHKKVIDSARIIAGIGTANLADVQEMIEHILKLGVAFWQIKTNLYTEPVKRGCQELLKSEALEEDFARLKGVGLSLYKKVVNVYDRMYH